jgi:hypothetical protein
MGGVSVETGGVSVGTDSVSIETDGPFVAVSGGRVCGEEVQAEMAINNQT